MALVRNCHVIFLFRFAQVWMVCCCLITSLASVASVCSAGAPLPGQGAASLKRWCTVAESSLVRWWRTSVGCLLSFHLCPQHRVRVAMARSFT